MNELYVFLRETDDVCTNRGAMRAGHQVKYSMESYII